jgi:UDP-N-acetylglucosamine transferase subunit ALG13
MRRIVSVLENLARAQPSQGPFVVQHGSTPRPVGWHGFPMAGGSAIDRHIQQADVVISHGGPATIAAVRAHNKIPIVVPRLKRFGEHVDDHQLEYVRRLEREQEVISVVDVDVLDAVVAQYQHVAAKMPKPGPHDPATAVERFATLVAPLER